MSRYIAIEDCKKCPHRHYYSAGAYECLKYGTVLPASHIVDIPEWCPLPKLPAAASAQGTEPVPPKEPTPEWMLKARAEGRAEFLAILLGESAEDFANDYTGDHPIGCTGDYGVHWEVEKLRASFAVDDATYSYIDTINGNWWSQQHEIETLRDKLERASQPPDALRIAAERVRDHACAYKAPADSLLVKRELIFQLAKALGGSITDRTSPPPADLLEASQRVSAIALDAAGKHAERVIELEAEVTTLRTVLRLARELCDAVDAADEDIGGCRPTSQILGELGPAVDACSTATKEEAL